MHKILLLQKGQFESFSSLSKQVEQQLCLQGINSLFILLS